MFLIVAIIRPHLLEQVSSALRDQGISGLTLSECRGEGRQKVSAHTSRGSQYGHHLEPRLRIEVAVANENLDAALDTIQGAATTGEVGDGKIFVYRLDQVVRIRTNERGDVALR